MKLLSAIFLIAAILIASISWKYVSPILSQNGTSVIYAMTEDGKNGSKPFTIKLPNNLTSKQHFLLSFTYIVAKEDGHKYPQYLQGILMQESKAGDMRLFRVAGLSNKKDDRYFGAMQIKMSAAKDVMKTYPELWKIFDTKTDEELQARLILDDEFNIRVASKYALLMGMNKDPIQAATNYNLGEGGAKGINPQAHDYTIKVKGYSQKMKNVVQTENKNTNVDKDEIQFKPNKVKLALR